MISVIMSNGSINPIRPMKFAKNKDLLQSLSQDARTKKKKNTVAIMNGKGTTSPVLGTHAV